MRSVTATIAVAVMQVALLACQAAAPNTPSPVATPRPTATHAQTPTSSPMTAPTPTAAAIETANPCASSTPENPAPPPTVVLTPANGADPVEGTLGSSTWCGTVGDALPPRAQSVATVPLGDPSTIELAVNGGVGFVGYRVGYWPASDWQGDEIALTGAASDPPATGIALGGPPAGDWMLVAHLDYGQLGDATYYWHVTSP